MASAPSRAPVFAAIAVALTLAACSSGAGPTAAPTVATPAGPTPTAGAAASEAAGASPAVYAVDVVQDATLGSYLVGEGGKSLYRLTKDKAGTSTCVDACATNWPPFILDPGEAAVAGTGVTGTISTIARPDGSKQVAIDGIPLYYFAGDTKAGDTKGQGLSGVWFLVAPGGDSVTATQKPEGAY